MDTHLVELDEILRRYAWNVLRKKSNVIRRLFLDQEDYFAEVDWSYLSIEHKLVKFIAKEKDGKTIETNFGDVVTGSRWIPLWSSDFDNKADLKQTHAFCGSRNTTVWVDVDLTQGYTIDKEINVDVNIPPKFGKFRAGRDNSLKVNKVKGQVFKEVLKWDVNSQMEIQPGWRGHASLLAKQECTPMEFEIRTTLFNTKGIVPVHFKRKTDKKVVFIVELEDFKEAFKLDVDGGVLSQEEKACVEVMFQKCWDADGEESSQSYPQLVTKGTCVCLTWSDQKVDIRTIPLPPDEGTLDGGVNVAKVVKEINVGEKHITVKSH